MATPRGKKKIPNFNEESNYRNTGVPLILDTSAINEEGMYEILSGLWRQHFIIIILKRLDLQEDLELHRANYH